MNNIVNQVAFLRSSREFPEEIKGLAFQCNKSYVDIANTVNARIIGIFSTNFPAITGESWFISGARRQQTLRQVYLFGAIAAGGSLAINILVGKFTFTRIFGTCITDLPDQRPIPYASVAANSNIDIRVTSTQIIISVGAASPNIISGIIDLEWLSSP